MNLKLRISKNTDLRDYQTSNYLRFAVTDLDISKEYPANFVTILPKYVYPKAKVQSNFVKIFEDQSRKIAKKLLKQALRNTDDQEIKKEIKERLKLLQPKPKNIVKCVVCDKEFESRRYRFGPRKTCFECNSKRYPI